RITVPDMVNQSNIRIREDDLAGAKEIVQHVGEPKKALAMAEERLQESHLDALLTVELKNYSELGGDVWEAKPGTIYVDDNTHPVKTFVSTENAIQRNLIIAKSGAETVKKAMTGDINVSIGGGSSRFAVKRSLGSNIIEDSGLGFTVCWVAHTSEGEVRVDVNFLYGREEESAEQTTVQQSAEGQAELEKTLSEDEKIFKRFEEIKASSKDDETTKQEILEYILHSGVEVSESFYTEAIKDSTWIPSRQEIEDAKREAVEEAENFAMTG
ncbi:MAG: hypothetical protein WA057_03605, partial [Candidatus Magasanikiibacteriota bacterium]